MINAFTLEHFREVLFGAGQEAVLATPVGGSANLNRIAAKSPTTSPMTSEVSG